jgi:hypothetical protein
MVPREARELPELKVQLELLEQLALLARQERLALQVPRVSQAKLAQPE